MHTDQKESDIHKLCYSIVKDSCRHAPPDETTKSLVGSGGKQGWWAEESVESKWCIGQNSYLLNFFTPMHGTPGSGDLSAAALLPEQKVPDQCAAYNLTIWLGGFCFLVTAGIPPS